MRAPIVPGITLALASLLVLVGTAGCGQVGFVNNERPGLSGTAPAAVAARAPEENENEPESAEPEHPLVATKLERSVVHVHEGTNACSGVMLSPRIVATSRRCVRDAVGVHALAQGKRDLGVRVELASSSLTWTERAGAFAVIPDCERRELDLALVVLAEPAAWIEPLPTASAPGPGASVDAIGYDTCEGGKPTKRAQIIEREDGAVILDRALCRGDTGGPVVGSDGALVGVQSRRRGGRESPRKETTVTRLDSAPARALVEQAKALAQGGDPSPLKPVACTMK